MYCLCEGVCRTDLPDELCQVWKCKEYQNIINAPPNKGRERRHTYHPFLFPFPLPLCLFASSCIFTFAILYLSFYPSLLLHCYVPFTPFLLLPLISSPAFLFLPFLFPHFLSSFSLSYFLSLSYFPHFYLGRKKKEEGGSWWDLNQRPLIIHLNRWPLPILLTGSLLS